MDRSKKVASREKVPLKSSDEQELDGLEHEYITRVLQVDGPNLGKVSWRLGISVELLRAKLKKYDISYESVTARPV